MTDFKKWPEKHPFALSLMVMLVIVLTGFSSIQVALTRATNAATEAHRQSDKNAAIVNCITDWVAAETDSLQDRDSVNKVARAASKDLWKSIRGLTAVPPVNGRKALLESIDRYLVVLKRVDKNALINPYPEIDKCLHGPELVSFLLSAYHPRYDKYCLGKKVTIRGSFGDDNIHGTDGPDVIFAYSGDDLIVSGKGNDFICGRLGNDTILGGQGYDTVDCGAGSDIALQSENTRYCE